MGRAGGRRRAWPERSADDPAASGPDASGQAFIGSALSATANGATASNEGWIVQVPPDPPAGFIERVLITLSGVRQPIVAILLLTSFFTVISGKPLDGLLLLIVATALAWDAGLRAREAAVVRAALLSGGASGRIARTDSAAELAASFAAVAPLSAAESEPTSAWRLRTRPVRIRVAAIGVFGAVSYSLIVGSFTRYSWPATAGVVGLGAGVVMVGWGGPTRRRQIPGAFSRPGVVTWGSMLIVGGLWELAALLEQPNIDTSSYAHPTISTLTDPLLGSSLGRSVALLGWIALGAYLVER